MLYDVQKRRFGAFFAFINPKNNNANLDAYRHFVVNLGKSGIDFAKSAVWG